MQCAVIDIGSNSMRLTVYEAEPSHFTILFKEKIMAGLAGYVAGGALSQEGIQCAVTGLLAFRQALKLLKIHDISVFATASLRNISNTQQAVAQIRAATGFEVEVLSGQDEAMLGYWGAMADLSLTDGLFADIGGASTEIAAFSHGELIRAESYPVGSLRLYQDCIKKILPGDGAKERMKKRIQETFGPMDGFPPQEVLACVGGTSRAVLKLARKHFGLSPSCRQVSAEQLEQLYAFLCRGDRDALELLLKLVPERIHTLLPGMTILRYVMRRLQVCEMVVSKYGVREGYLCQRIQRKS